MKFVWEGNGRSSMNIAALIIIVLLALLFGVALVLGIFEIPRILRITKSFRGMGDDSP